MRRALAFLLISVAVVVAAPAIANGGELGALDVQLESTTEP